MIPHPLISTLFPYTTLFRSSDDGTCRMVHGDLEARIDRVLPDRGRDRGRFSDLRGAYAAPGSGMRRYAVVRSEEHTSELQSRPHLVCRLLLEKKKKKQEITS